MKRLFAILLVLCLILCGCEVGGNTPTKPNTPGQSGGEQTTDPTPGQSDEPTRPAEVEPIEVDGAALCVTVTINPKFEIYLDLFNVILEVKAQNEDAENLLADLQVVGKPYGEGVTQILAEAEQQGFLKNRAKLSIATKELVDGGWNSHSEATLLDPIEVYKDTSGLVLTCDFYPAEKPLDEIVYVHTNNRDGYREEICYDSTDRHILTRMYFDDGSYCETDWVKKTSYRWNADGSYTYEDWKDGFSSSYTIHPDGTVDRVMRTVDKLGNRTDWELFLYADGSSWENFYDKSGNHIKSSYTYPDGSSSESFYENGILIREVSINADGSTQETFYENGQPVRTEITNADGSTREELLGDGSNTGTNSDGSTFIQTLYPSGSMKTYDITWPNGDYQKLTYYENGNMETYIEFRDGRYVEQYYDENGQITSNFQRDSDGTEYDGDYENGILKTSVTTFPNGDYECYTCYENGRWESRISFRDGAYEESYYDVTGMPTSYFRRDPDGREFESIYENGVSKSDCVTWPNGNYEQNTYHENGSVYSNIAFRDGTYVENYYDENGLMTRHFQRDSDGTEYDWDYENGEPVGYTVTYPDGSTEYFKS